MNNSFARLVDGVCAQLRAEVLPRIDDEYARSQVWGVINLLNTFKLRADWSPALLQQQLAAQRSALDEGAALLQGVPAAPEVPVCTDPVVTPVAELMAERDRRNQALAALGAWLDGKEAAALSPAQAQRLEQVLASALRAEVDLELKFSPRPLFAEMSGEDGR